MRSFSFVSDFTKPMEIGGGIEYTIDAQAFELDKGLIPCIVRCTEQQPNSAPYVTKSLTYEATFSVPLNGIKRDKNNVLLEAPEFDFLRILQGCLKRCAIKNLPLKTIITPIQIPMQAPIRAGLL